MRRAAEILLALVLALGSPAGASAATATLVYEEPIPVLDIEDAYALAVEAGRGEENRITITGDGSGYTVTDTGAALEPREGCFAVTANRLRCPTSRPVADHSVFVDAGDREDHVGVPGLDHRVAVEVRGGGGRDLIYGGDGHDLLSGGSGNDGLVGAGGFDTLDGGAGDDVLHGGSGRDRVSYQARRRPVAVDLARGTGGADGERDRLHEIEEVIGGAGADVLRGGAGDDTLVGGVGAGRDRVVGRGGDDILIGHRATGGRGDDSLDARVLRCGRGADVVYRGTHRPPGPFPRSCERLAAVFVVVQPHPIRSGRRRAVFGVRCHKAVRCRGRLQLRDGRGVLGRQAFRIRRGPDPAALHRVRIRLRRRTARRVATLRIDGIRAYQRSSFRVRLR